MGKVLYINAERSRGEPANVQLRMEAVGQASMKMLRLSEQHFADIVHHIDHPKEWERAFEAFDRELRRKKGG